MKRFGLACLLVLAMDVSAVERDSATAVAVERHRAEVTVPPVRVTDQFEATLLALKQNDFAALLEVMEAHKNIDELADDWNRRAERQREHLAKRAQEAELSAIEQDPAQLTWKRLQSPAGIDALVEELQPKLAESTSETVMQFNLGFGALLTSLAQDEKLAAHEVQQLTKLMYAVQDWTARVDFADRERLRRALAVAARLVQQTGLKRHDEVQAMSFDELVVHGDAMIRSVKQVLAIYELDADEILNSIRVSEVDARGDRATLRVEARVLGVDLAHEQPMRYWRGEWIDAASADERERWSNEHWPEAEAQAALPVGSSDGAETSPNSPDAASGSED